MNYQIRPVERGDTYHIYALMNREDVCMWTSLSAPVTWDRHEVWFDRYVDSKLGVMFVLEYDGKVVGEVHCDPCETNGIRGASIHVALQPEARSKGIARWMLKRTMPIAHELQNVTCLLATIRPENKKSIRCFSSLGFRYHSAQGELNCYVWGEKT